MWTQNKTLKLLKISVRYQVKFLEPPQFSGANFSVYTYSFWNGRCLACAAVFIFVCICLKFKKDAVEQMNGTSSLSYLAKIWVLITAWFAWADSKMWKDETQGQKTRVHHIDEMLTIIWDDCGYRIIVLPVKFNRYLWNKLTATKPPQRRSVTVAST